MSQTSVFPVDYQVEPQLTDRNRITVLFRLFLAIPQLLITGGGPSLGYGANILFGLLIFKTRTSMYSGGASGLAGVAFTMAVVAWFAIMFWHRHPRGLWDFAAFALRWQARTSAYTGLLRDDYPPFSDDNSYPARIVLPEFPSDVERKSVGWRLILLIPHALLLVLLGIPYLLSLIVAWLAILVTGSYPAGLYTFAIGYQRWSFRVQAYSLLVLDDYPPFSLT